MRNLIWFFILILISGNYCFSQNLKINEFVASNNQSYEDPGTGNYPDWIEIYNSSGSSIDISGYYLTDDSGTPTKWSFPASTVIASNSYLLVLADGTNTGLHANFKLSASGEEIYLYDNVGVLVDSISFGSQVTDISHGRASGGTWVYYSPSSPGSANVPGDEFTGISQMPTFSVGTGMYSGSFSVLISAALGATIYYTTDGTNPDQSSSLYTSSIPVSATTVIKAIAVEAGNLPSYIGMETYLFGETQNLDALILTTEVDSIGNPYSWVNKLYIDGRIKVDLIQTDGQHIISQYADFETKGNTSSSLPQINGKISAKKRYGDKDFDCELYPNKSLDELKSFNIKNTSQDWEECHLRDQFINNLISYDLLMDSLSFEDNRPVVVYINGRYHGFLFIQEDNNSDYFKHNYDASNAISQLYGTIKDMSYLDLSTQSGFEEFEQDVHFRDYMLYFTIVSFGADEYPAFWQDTIANTKLMMNFHDYDMILLPWFDASSLNLEHDNTFSVFNSYKQDEVIQLVRTQLNLVFDTTRAFRILDEMVNELDPEMSRHATTAYQFWHDSSNPPGTGWHEPFSTLTEWHVNLDTLKNRYKRFYEILSQKLLTKKAGLSYIDVTHAVSDSTQGYIRVYDITQLEQSRNEKYCAGLPIKFKAVAKQGYRFSHWEGLSSSTDEEIIVNTSSNDTITAVFEPIPIVLTDLVINEVQPKNDGTITDEFGEYNDWIEIYNNGSSSIDLGGYYLSDNRDILNKHCIVDTSSSSTTINSSGYLLFWADDDTEQGVNHLNFKLNPTDQVYLVYPDGVTIADSISFVEVGVDSSYGCITDGANTEILFITPTPNASNGVASSVIDLSAFNFEVYPNPVENIVNVSAKKNFDVKLLNSGGLILINMTDINREIKIDMSSYSSGLYFIILTGDNFIEKKKIVKL